MPSKKKSNVIKKTNKTMKSLWRDDLKKFQDYVKSDEKKRAEIYKKWVSKYKKHWNINPKHDDYYWNWLENDIGRWANDDYATMFGLTPKYKNIRERKKNIDTIEPQNSDNISKLVKFNLSNDHSARSVFDKTFYVLTLEEIISLDKFLEKNNFR